MIFARNRKAGSFSLIDCGQPRFGNPTPDPHFRSQNQRIRKCRLFPNPLLKF
jgi:hypothetical protein